MGTSLTPARIIGNAGAHCLRAVRLSAFLAAAALTATATATAASAGNSTAPERPPNASAQSPLAGIFTGAFVNGAPVYRLPTISVVGHREADIARLQRNEHDARVRPSRARPAAGPQARPVDTLTVASGTRVN
jgi:hypothetical protein